MVLGRTDHATRRPSDHPLEHRGRGPTQPIWRGLAQDHPAPGRMRDGRACGARGNAACVAELRIVTRKSGRDIRGDLFLYLRRRAATG